MTEDKLKSIFVTALGIFNQAMETHYNEDNVKLAFYNSTNGRAVYDEFTSKYGFHHEDKDNDYFKYSGASAYIGDEFDGIMIQIIDGDTYEGNLICYIHESSHIYCCHNEIGGEIFFDKYCMGSGEDDGYMNAGYAIWRETIANIMTDIIICREPYEAEDIKSKSDDLLVKIIPYDTEKKYYMADILEMIFLCRKNYPDDRWDEFKERLTEAGIQIIPVYDVFNELLEYSGYVYEINSELIYKLGLTFLSEVAKMSMVFI